MVTPVDVSYSGAPPIRGGRAAAGGGVPAWAPATGAVANIGVNSIRDIDANAIPMVYSGAAWLPWLGEYGSSVFQGEGHTDGGRNSVFRHDFKARLITRIKDAAPIFLHSDGYCGDDVSGWNWSATSGTGLQIGESVTGHMYGNTAAIPPNVIPNTPMGALVKMGTMGIHATGQKGTARLHVLAVGEQLWTNPSSITLPVNIGYGCTWYDSVRTRVVMAYSQDFTQDLIYWVVNTPNVGTLHTNGVTDAYYANGFHLLADDLYALVNIDSRYTAQLRIIDPNDNTCYTPTMTGPAPSSSEFAGAVDWVESSRGFVYFASATGTAYFLKAPTNPRTGAWVWSVLVSGATVAANLITLPAFGRSRYVPALKAISYLPSYGSPMQGIGVALP